MDNKNGVPQFTIDEVKDKYDDSTLIQDQRFELTDGRPVYAMFWKEVGYSFLTYLFSVNGIELLNKKEITKYIMDNGIKLKDNTDADIMQDTDCKGNVFWNFTITIGRVDD
jgi:hypothetical protein